jgi:hypothetical protein
LLLILLGVGACTESRNNTSASPQVGTDACSIDAQKQFVLDAMRDVYYWNDLLPASVDLDTYTTPEDLLEFLISFQPLDEFSYIDLAASLRIQYAVRNPRRLALLAGIFIRSGGSRRV